mmetsp:Transcript_37386/g.77553  ORF Transcript_37386/g.77553 Transcript_37386/m.77553 type:complete len:641 (-) Transcript_37386:68-1990(-)
MPSTSRRRSRNGENDSMSSPEHSTQPGSGSKRKSNVIWEPDEDEILLRAVVEEQEDDGEEDWDAIAQQISGKSAVQCLKRYIVLNQKEGNSKPSRIIPNVSDSPSHEREPKETIPEAPQQPYPEEEEEEEEDELDDMERIGSKSVQELVAEHQQTKKEPVRKLMSQYRYNEKQLEKDYGKDAIVNPTKDKNTKSESSSHKEEPTTGLESLYDNVLGSNPRVLEAMMRWSVRLKEVPYREWTIGASTALDHWIARQVLQMSEETWATLLEGNDADLLPLGRAIVQTREALFPETLVRPVEDEEDDLLGASADPLGTLDIPQDDPFARNDDEMSLEDLLNSLGDINSSTDSLDALKPSAPEGVNTENGKRLIEELQAYRKKNVETPFDSWQDTDKLQFEDWFQSKFAPVMLPDMTDPTVDWESVKKSLLAAPPVSEKENNEFWSSLQTEQDAIELLEKMRKDGPPPGASILQTAFWDLSYEAQLQQLLNLGAIRPLLDEYADESDRLDFIQRYYDVLMTGVPIEYLVPDDEEGSITVKDMNFETIRSLNIDRNDPRKFKLQVLPYRGALESEKEHTDDGGNVLTTQQLEQSRALYMAWNEHKANRARYEEEMFTSNRLGLRYGDPPEPIFRSPSPERDEKKK